jgi:zinc/manganese transport system substrate-binding protein
MAHRLTGAVLAIALLAACGTSVPTSASGSGRVRIVAAENFWGSIASQVGGDRVSVTSLIANPNTDPHDYEATPDDARRVAGAQYVILNGVGYDPWGQKLIDANPVPGRRVLVAGDLLGKHDGDNPHVWYSPVFVSRFVDRVASDLGDLDPAGASYFRQQASEYRTAGLKGYNEAIATIKEKYGGTRVGATESIFSYLASDLGLDLVTPYSYLKAISAGADPSAADKAEAEREITGREITIFVFNSQNSTPEVQGLVAKAHTAGIPVVPITETLTPQGATFQEWQTRQLQDILAALGG